MKIRHFQFWQNCIKTIEHEHGGLNSFNKDITTDLPQMNSNAYLMKIKKSLFKDSSLSWRGWDKSYLEEFCRYYLAPHCRQQVGPQWPWLQWQSRPSPHHCWTCTGRFPPLISEYCWWCEWSLEIYEV